MESASGETFALIKKGDVHLKPNLRRRLGACDAFFPVLIDENQDIKLVGFMNDSAKQNVILRPHSLPTSFKVTGIITALRPLIQFDIRNERGSVGSAKIQLMRQEEVWFLPFRHDEEVDIHSPSEEVIGKIAIEFWYGSRDFIYNKALNSRDQATQIRIHAQEEEIIHSDINQNMMIGKAFLGEVVKMAIWTCLVWTLSSLMKGHDTISEIIIMLIALVSEGFDFVDSKQSMWKKLAKGICILAIYTTLLINGVTASFNVTKVTEAGVAGGYSFQELLLTFVMSRLALFVIQVTFLIVRQV